MKFTTPAFVALATMATFSLAVPGIVVVDVGAADDNLPSDEPPDDCVTVEKRTGCGHNHCGECNGTGCKMGSGITYPCTRGKCTKQSGGGDGKPCGYDDTVLWSYTDVYCPGK